MKLAEKMIAYQSFAKRMLSKDFLRNFLFEDGKIGVTTI